MRIGSLFSGIGGLELGLELAGVGHTIWQVEQSSYCQAVLAKHWPTVERFEDVKNVGVHNLARIDLICGGFPCQDVSSAGKRAGLAGAHSGLWFEFERIVAELRPDWVVVENVASGARAWVDVVVGGLEQLGYACLPVPIAAADVGAPHERKRIFVVAAHADAKGQHARAVDAEVGGAPTLAPDPNASELRVKSGRRGGARGGGASITQHAGWRTAQPDMVRVVDGVSRGLDSPRRRIAALGNAVVPQCAEVIGHLIMELNK